jgi:hypothetical protein
MARRQLVFRGTRTVDSAVELRARLSGTDGRGRKSLAIVPGFRGSRRNDDRVIVLRPLGVGPLHARLVLARHRHAGAQLIRRPHRRDAAKTRRRGRDSWSSPRSVACEATANGSGDRCTADVAKPTHGRFTAVRSAECVGDFSRLESTTWKWWAAWGSNPRPSD